MENGNNNRYATCVFTYGTLMEGGFNHPRAGNPDAILDARVKGRLYGMTGGFPALAVDGMYATGTLDLARDIAVTGAPTGSDTEDFNVRGELFVYADEAEARLALRTMDQLEGFRPGGSYSMYTRKMVPVAIEGLHGEELAVWAWVYVMDDEDAERISGGLIECGSWRERPAREARDSYGYYEAESCEWCGTVLTDDEVELCADCSKMLQDRTFGRVRGIYRINP